MINAALILGQRPLLSGSALAIWERCSRRALTQPRFLGERANEFPVQQAARRRSGRARCRCGVHSHRPGSGSDQPDRISVTGSRIKSTDIETSQPVLSLTRADIEKQGVTSVADILQRVAANGAALNRTFNNGGDGSAGISLRNLGSARTLVLVNGRRWTTGLMAAST